VEQILSVSRAWHGGSLDGGASNCQRPMSFLSTLPLLLEGFRKNTSLVEEIERSHGDWSQELKFLGQLRRFIPLLKAS
jgi:hypothetical protein